MDYSLLSKHRTALMGIAMIMVILFHTGGSRHDTVWFCISRCGNVGVDMFLFLSGIGMWFAWKGFPGKDDGVPGSTPLSCSGSLLHFYARRYRRIYPAWFIIACLYYIPLCMDGRLNIADTLLSITVNWGFWEHDELTFWFIPAIMMLYTAAPAYISLIRRQPVWRWMPVAAMMLCVLIQYWSPLHNAVGHLEIFFSRLPIFMLGINIGQPVMERRTLGHGAQWVLLLMLVMSAIVCINFENGLRGRFPLFIERMVYIPLSVSMLLLSGRLLSAAPQRLCRLLSFIGGISLELYLIHYHFVLKYLRELHLGYWLTAISTIVISALAAWLLHKITAPPARSSGSPRPINTYRTKSKGHAKQHIEQ